MYIPAHFAETNPGALRELIEQNNFATLVSTDGARPFATHLPFLYAPDDRALLGHMARANPHWQALANSGGEVLVIFQGPHDYISPGWYAEPGVPTWNYAAVHVYGTFELVTAPDAHRKILADLTAQHESGRPEPWRADFDAPFVTGMLRGTIAFRIGIRDIEGKVKMSQNRADADRERVIAELERDGSDNARGVARLMRERE